MSGLSEYRIDIVNLKNKQYQYQFSIDPSFFLNFEEGEIKKGSLDCLIVLRKTEGFIEASFNIQGTVELVCDRSLDKFDHDVKLDKLMIFKFGDEDREIDDEVELISHKRQRIDMSQYIYEFIMMNIPMKKLHPRYNTDVETAEEELIYSSSGKNPPSEGEQETIDPRWEALKKLKDN